MPEIFYAGGTTVKDISSADLIGDIVKAGRQALFLPTRPEIKAWLLHNAKPGDRIVIMGARDDTLSDFARDVLASVNDHAQLQSVAE
jgi:UDP-N-acetylmuramate--alanine ligase